MLGYEPVAEWVSVYDAQAVKLLDGNDEMVITLSMNSLPPPNHSLEL